MMDEPEDMLSRRRRRVLGRGRASAERRLRRIKAPI
jgi:hypothetical protein